MLARLATVIAELPDLPSQDVGTDPKPYIAVFGIGFLIAVFGHLFKVKVMIAAGVLMVFMATVVLPLVAALRG
ncbi:MAG TPA: hypothetical protein VJT75_16525 [Thermoleophilaceae bacterium]|nr:hypothetical protein [Thermoleophilaceae bacterium]